MWRRLYWCQKSKNRIAKKCRKQGISGSRGLSEDRFRFPDFFVLRVSGNWSTVKKSGELSGWFWYWGCWVDRLDKWYVELTAWLKGEKEKHIFPGNGIDVLQMASISSRRICFCLSVRVLHFEKSICWSSVSCASSPSAKNWAKSTFRQFEERNIKRRMEVLNPYAFLGRTHFWTRDL